ncbi:hypothetical protein ES705_05072 [subsurface metagenome]
MPIPIIGNLELISMLMGAECYKLNVISYMLIGKQIVKLLNC